jgi:hypothetical protein
MRILVAEVRVELELNRGNYNILAWPRIYKQDPKSEIGNQPSQLSHLQARSPVRSGPDQN